MSKIESPKFEQVEDEDKAKRLAKLKSVILFGALLGGSVFEVGLTPEINPGLKNLVDSFVENPVVMQDVFDPKTQTFTMAEVSISRDHRNFPLAFKEWLVRIGYEVIEDDSESIEEIKKLLAGFSDENKDKKDILAKLPTMSRLQITGLLESLNKIAK